MPDDDLIALARDGFAEAQKHAGTADIVARVRRMPDGTASVMWERRGSAQSKLRLGSIGGRTPHLGKIAAELEKKADKGTFYAIVITRADDSDARLERVAKTCSEAPR